MARTYAQITTLVLQMLQDTGIATYAVAETGYAIEESLKEFAHYDPHIVPVVFKIESRTGNDETAATVTSTLTDEAKEQFLDTDPTQEKVIHNTTDNTWAVVLTHTSSSVLTLSADIMDSGEHYEIYNKRCWNKKQIYIGGEAYKGVTDYLWIDSVEYPIGTKRNWKIYNEVLEIDVDTVRDSNTQLSQLPNVDVLVRFAKPHRLCQLGGLTGQVHTAGTAADTSQQVKGFDNDDIVEIGDEFHIANHRSLYTMAIGVTLKTQTGVGSTLNFFPGLETATSIDDAISFTNSTLKPQHEEIFCHLVAARCVLSDNINYINAINKGGPEVYTRFRDWGERKLAEVLSKLDRISIPRTSRVYPKD